MFAFAGLPGAISTSKKYILFDLLRTYLMSLLRFYIHQSAEIYFFHPSKQETLTQCWVNVCQLSATLAQLKLSIGSTSIVCWDLSGVTAAISSLEEIKYLSYFR